MTILQIVVQEINHSYIVFLRNLVMQVKPSIVMLASYLLIYLHIVTIVFV